MEGFVMGVQDLKPDSSSLPMEEIIERLHQSEERYRGVVESQNDLVVRVDSHGCFTFVNDAYCRKLGKSRDEILGKNFRPFVHFDDLARLLDFIKDLSRPPYRGFIEYRSWFRNEWRLTLWEGYAVRDASNKIVEFQGVGRDVTQQREVERALVESEQKFRIAFESSPMPQALTDSQGRFVQVNQAYCELFGYSESELEKMTFFDVTHEDDKLASAEYLRSLNSRETRLIRAEKKYVAKDGRTIYALLAVSSIVSETGEFKYNLAQIIDLTERVLQERLIRHHALELTRSNTELSQYAHVVAHDIREPLRMVTSFVELLTKHYGQKFDEQAKEFAHYAIDGAQRAQELIHDLLSFAKVTQIDEIEVQVELAKILEKVEASLKTAIEQSGAQFEYKDLPESVPGVEAHLVQVFQNLFSNSIKYRSASSPKISVQVQARAKDFLFQVEDNGLGIEPQYRERVFQMFKRLHARKDYPGTGIGLAIVKKIIESRGGQIWIESPESKSGSRFVFTWPKRRIPTLSRLPENGGKK